MEQQTEQPGAATAGTPPAPVSADALMDTLSASERDSWHMTGELPDRVTIGKTQDAKAASSTASTPTPESSPDTPVDQAASTDAKTVPASEPGQPAKKSTEKGAHARNAELDAEISGLQERLKLRRALRDELATLERPRQDAKTPDPSAGKPLTKAEHERYLAMPDAPKEEDFDNYTQFSAALGVFITDQRWQEHQARSQATAALRSREDGLIKMGETATARIQEYAKSNPDFQSKVNPELLEVPTATFMRLNNHKVGPQHVLAEEILKSEHTGPLLVHFSTEEGAQEWARLCRLGSKDDFMRAFGRIEARFDGSTARSEPAPKTVSDAPTPPITLGSRTADTADPLEAALKRKDTDAYIREANRRELAALGL